MKLTKLILLLLLFSPVWPIVQDSILERYDQYIATPPDSTHYSQKHYEEIIAATADRNPHIRVMSFNMLNQLYDANQPFDYGWPFRQPRVIELIEHIKPDIILDQELCHNQVRNLLACLGDRYAFYGIGQDDGHQGGELNGIFYYKPRFELVEERVWFMSETPNTFSVGPHSSHGRTLTMVQLYDRITGLTTAYFCTHFDFGGVDAREYQAQFCMRIIEEYAQKMPVIFGGDLNTFPNRPDLKKLPFYDGDRVEQILTGGSLQEARTKSLLGHVGPISTFTNEGESPIPFKGIGTPGVFLDHIYVNKWVNVIIHGVETAQVNNHYPSDHLPILIDVAIDKAVLDQMSAPAIQPQAGGPTAN